MSTRWAKVNLLGDKPLASRFLRYAKQKWLSGRDKKGAGRSRVMSWRPHPDVYVRVQWNPNKILIRAESGAGRVYTLLDPMERVTFVEINTPPEPNVEWGGHSDVTAQTGVWQTYRGKRSRSISIDENDARVLAQDVYGESGVYFRGVEWESPDVDVFLYPVEIIEQPGGTDAGRPLNDALRLWWPFSYTSGDEEHLKDGVFCITADTGKTWRQYASTILATGSTYRGSKGVDLNGNPVARFAFHAAGIGGGSTGIDILFSDDEDPDLFTALFASNIRSNYQLTYIGGTTLELVDYYFSHQIVVGPVSADPDEVSRNSYRFLSYDGGTTWTSNLAFPGNYSGNDAIWICCKMRNGHYMAIHPDADSNVYAWTSDNGATSWVRGAVLPGIPPESAFPPDDWPWITSLTAVDDGVFFNYVPDPSSGPYEGWLYAITDSGSTAVRRPRVYFDGNIPSGVWDSSRQMINVFPVSSSGSATLETAVLVICGTDLTDFDPGAVSPDTLNDYYFNPTAHDAYFIYSTRGGQDTWTRGGRIATGGVNRTFAWKASMHGTPKTKFNSIYFTIGY